MGRPLHSGIGTYFHIRKASLGAKLLGFFFDKQIKLGLSKKRLMAFYRQTIFGHAFFCPSGDKISVAGKQLKCLRVP